MIQLAERKNMNKKKLRFMITTLSGGGAEKVLIDLLCQLDPDKYEISLLTISGGIHESKVPSYVNYKCILPFPNNRLINFLKRLVCKLPPKVFAKLFLRGKHDIEIAYLEGLPTRFIAATNAPIKIAFVHCDISVNNIIAPLYKNNVQCLEEYRSFSKVCFVSEMSKNGFENTVGVLDNSCIIHNVLNYKQMKLLMLEKPALEYHTEGLRLLTIGRLIKEKAYDRLLRIVAKLEKDYSFELLIIGEGSERSNLEHIIAENNIHSAKLIGFQKNPYSFIKNADLFICSSLTEGYSTAVTEAIALGLPVVTTRCAGMDEILDNGKYGIIVDNSEEDLYSALKNIFENRIILDKLKESVIKQSEKINSTTAINEYTELFDSPPCK